MSVAKVPRGTKMTSGIPPDEEFQISLDEAFNTLGDASRRWILTRLSGAGPHDEAESIPEASITDNEVLEPFISEIYDVHLPELDESGFVEWVRDDEVIRRGPRFEEIVPIIRLIVEHEDELPVEWP